MKLVLTHGVPRLEHFHPTTSDVKIWPRSNRGVSVGLKAFEEITVYTQFHHDGLEQFGAAVLNRRSPAFPPFGSSVGD
jgi:hypothetical protein